MAQLPRIAIGSIQPNTNCETVACGLMRLLADRGLQAQHFLSRACFSPHDGALAASGNTSRHLDSWLMSPSVCRETFVRGSGEADVALVEGRFQPPLNSPRENADREPKACGGSLESLCDWLDLPRLGVVDVSAIEPCLLPTPPAKLDALFLDRFADDRHFRHWQTTLEALWGVPVVGGLADFHSAGGDFDAIRCGHTPDLCFCDQLARQIERRTDLAAIWRLASSRPLPSGFGSSPSLAAKPIQVRIALAYDEAFHCYFADTFDLLEMLGATIVDFSPLRDERLPEDVDVVYFGCGHPEHWAEDLAANQCMMASLRRYLCGGGRLYGEGGGLAYLCQHIETPEGGRVPMLGAFSATARLNPYPLAPRPVELTLARGNWLAAADATLRGYLNTYWNIDPTSPLAHFAVDDQQKSDLVGQYQAIGSRLHLNFAAQPEFLGRFIRPLSVPAQSAPV